MSIATTHPNRLVKGATRKLWIGAIIILVAALIVGAASFAFLFESPSIKYKFGWDKTLLRTGKIIGLSAAVLMLFQLPIAGRFKALDRIFSLPGLYTIHRYGGYIVGALVVLHPILVFWPEGRLMIPFEMRYWPEWVGAGLLAMVLIQISLGKWRKKFIKRYQNWLLLHRAMGVAIFALLVVHVLYVSETFEYDGLPRTAVLVAAAVTGLLWMAVRAQRLRARKHPFEVGAISPAGQDAYAIDLKPVGNHHFHYLPGQFAFFSFKGGSVSPEWHPFTISSSPGRPDAVQLTVRRSGDWTDHVTDLKTGQRVNLHGPFGRFSHLFEDKDRELIMIAGGIGITPMLSMLRQMSHDRDNRRITLIWSNRTARHLFGIEELDKLNRERPNFRWIPVFTQSKEPIGEFGRLTRGRLEVLLASCSRDAAVFLCGPPGMIIQARLDLSAIGFHAHSIHNELFGL